MFRSDLPLALTFDDVLLVPQYSEVLPDSACTHTTLGDVNLAVPFLSAAMDTVTEQAMAITMARQGGLGVLHKNTTIEQQCNWVKAVKELSAEQGEAADRHGKLVAAAAIGVAGDFECRLKELVQAGVDVIVMDTAHGHSQTALKAAALARTFAPNVTLICGNVATADATRAIFDAGADVVKVGIGPGSICTTRIVAGVGVPQLTAIAQCREAVPAGKQLIADGGIRTSGDIAKALAAGASAVMIGSLFAATDEAPGERILINGEIWKRYRGMGSLAAMEQGSAERYFQTGSRKRVAEGVEARVRGVGPVADRLATLHGGLRSSMGYCGAADLSAFYSHAQFVRISGAGLAESHVHDVKR